MKNLRKIVLTTTLIGFGLGNLFECKALKKEWKLMTDSPNYDFSPKLCLKGIVKKEMGDGIKSYKLILETDKGEYTIKVCNAYSKPIGILSKKIKKGTQIGIYDYGDIRLRTCDKKVNSKDKSFFIGSCDIKILD